MRPTVAVVAADEPQTEANMVQPSTVRCDSRPGTRRSQGERPVNSASEIFVRKRISAIRMKSGSASSSGETTTL